MARDAVILVATHKRAEMPEDSVYLPLHVGHALASVEFGYQADDDGVENISALNRSYCELTALYWAWKNLDAEVIGLSHYRRYFVGSAPGPGGASILSSDEAAALLSEVDVVLGRPRNYYVESIDSHYRNAHNGGDLDVLRVVIAEQAPEYVDAYDGIMRGRRLSLYNMFLMRRELADRYCEWLFPLLDEVDARIQNEGRSAYQQRTFGYLGERLLNVWVAANADDIRVATRKIVNTEGEPKLRKAIALVQRKITGASKS